MPKRFNERFLYLSAEAEGYVAAINILAVQYLIKTPDVMEYSRLVDIVYGLTDEELNELDFYLSMDTNISTIGAVITNGDFDKLLKILLEYLKEKRK